MEQQLIDWSACPGIEIDARRQSGAPIFAGTRVPVDVVLNNIHHGGTPEEIAEILENLPVTREQTTFVLCHLKNKLARLVRS